LTSKQNRTTITEKKVRIHYEETEAKFASQFLVNATEEDIIIGFSSGYIPEPGKSSNLLSVHSRIALSIPGAVRLHAMLDEVLKQHARSKDSVNRAKAGFPQLAPNSE
jgi:hypothetical protein